LKTKEMASIKIVQECMLQDALRQKIIVTLTIHFNIINWRYGRYIIGQVIVPVLNLHVKALVRIGVSVSLLLLLYKARR